MVGRGCEKRKREEPDGTQKERKRICGKEEDGKRTMERGCWKEDGRKRWGKRILGKELWGVDYRKEGCWKIMVREAGRK